MIVQTVATLGPLHAGALLGWRDRDILIELSLEGGNVSA